MRLDQLDRLGRDAGKIVGPAQRFFLPGGARRVDSLPLAVARGSHRADHGVDAIAVSRGVIQAFQDQHPQALAQDRAVGRGIKRPGLARRRKSRRFAEAHVDENVVKCIDTARDGQVAAAGGKLQEGHIERAERTGAGRVDDAVRPAQVEPVRDPAGGHVAQEARKRVFLPADVRRGDPLDHGLGHGAFHARTFERAPPDRLPEPGRKRDDQLERAADPQDHTDLVTVELTFGGISGVLERLFRNQETEELRGIGGLDRMGRDPEIEGRKIDWREKTTAAGISAVASLGVLIVVVVGSPVGFRNVRDGVDAVTDVGPVPGEVLGSRKHAAHPDNRHRNRGPRSERIQVFSLSSVTEEAPWISASPDPGARGRCYVRRRSIGSQSRRPPGARAVGHPRVAKGPACSQCGRG